MRVLITGATGFVGRALVARLLRDGHQVTAWVRDLDRARSQLGAEVRFVEAPPGEPGGALVAHALFVAPTLRRIFAFRRQMIRLRFGACAG